MEFLIPAARSLKEKRRVMKSLKQRLRNKFNCSVAETGYKDKWGRSRITVCVVSDDSRHANTQLNNIVSFADVPSEADMIDYQIEML